MPTTTKGFPYPSNSDDVDIPGDIQALAESIDTALDSFGTGDISAVVAGTGLSGGATSGSATLSIDTAVTADLTTKQTIAKKALKAPREITDIVASGATGTINIDLLNQAVVYYTGNASANFTLNFRGDASNTLNSLMDVEDSISVVFLNTNGATAYRPTVFNIDGSAVTPKWSGGTAPSAGNASAIDAYSFTIIKTASATFTVLAGQGKFA